MWKNGLFTMWFQDFANSLLSELQLPNKPLPRQKPTAETFSDTPLPGQAIQRGKVWRTRTITIAAAKPIELDVIWTFGDNWSLLLYLPIISN